MQHYAIRLAAALVTFLIGLASSSILTPLLSGAASAGEAEREVLGVEREYIRAHLERDVAALELVLADDFSSFGGRVRKEHRLALLASAGFRVISLDTTDVHVTVAGDEALVVGQAVMQARFRRKEFVSPPYEFTRRYAKREGRWQIVSMSFSPAW